MKSDGLSRRQFASLALPATLLALSRTRPASAAAKDVAAWYDEDLKDPNPRQVLQRPSPLDPKDKVSILGLGGVRLPVLSGNLGSQEDPIDYDLSSKMIDYALRHGINFFDTGYFYHAGDSERFYGQALSKHPRESFHFVTKAPPWNIAKLADAKRIFQEQLDRCKMSYFDCYELHSLVREEDYERTFVKTGVIEYFKEERAKGRIRHLGFSFHGRPQFLERLLSEKWAEVVTILVNGIDWKGVNFSEQLYGLIEKAGLPVVVMEPLCGGRLARLKPKAHEILARYAPEKTDASWSLRFAAHPKNVMTVLTGFTRFGHLQENVGTFAADAYAPFTAEEHRVYAEAIAADNDGAKGVPCSGCRYCMPCPYGVDIPRLFHFWNMRLKWAGLPAANDRAARLAFLTEYSQRFSPLRNASRCIACGECAKKCPQWQFTVSEELAKIDAYFREIERENPDFEPSLCTEARI